MLKIIDEVIKERQIYIDDPSFYIKSFTYACEVRKAAYAIIGDNFKRVLAEEYNTISKRLDKTFFQDSCQVRNILRTRRLANLLINDKGEINLSVIPKLIDFLKEHMFSLGPNRQYDAKRQEHLYQVLVTLNENKDVVRLLKNINKPMSHRYADQIIRDTLQLQANTQITEAHAKRAVLSAWMCLLRQNVGSCFATAPAIIIQSEQPVQFLQDIAELLNTGRLKRTFGGIEYAVPLSTTWGGGDLKKLFILRTGEDFEKSEIWLSPGLMGAFEAAKLIDEDAEPLEKAARSKALIISAIDIQSSQSYFVTSAEEIIRKVLLKSLNLTNKDLHDYEHRPKVMVFGGLLMQGSAVSKDAKGKSQLVENYQNLMSAAGNALKSLTDNAMLRAWEFSIASFAETKSQFTRWNLYSSLGLAADDAGGIGACLYQEIKHRLDIANRRVHELQDEYEHLFHQLKMIEARMQNIQSEKEAQWMKAEYQAKRNEFYTFEQMRDKVHTRAKNLSNFFNYLIDKYDTLFPQYFQEVYDADMHDVSVGPYDDSPAGFRLLYKHGRTNTSQWTLVHTPDEFIEVLTSFFTATERELSTDPDLIAMQEDISEITTRIVSHVRTKEFLETAFYRMAVAHQTKPIKDPLEHLDKIDKKPWAYTSGGTMGTLVSCYYKLSGPPMEVCRWVEDPTELLVFLADTLKQIPPNLMKEYQNGKNKSMLMHSPTHAFLLKPSSQCFKRAWTTDAFTYIWARDNMIAPKKRKIESILLDEDKMLYLIEKMSLKIPQNYRHYFRKILNQTHGTKDVQDFRNFIVDNVQQVRGPKGEQVTIIAQDEVDSLLYTLLPVFPLDELKERVYSIFSTLTIMNDEDKALALDIFDLAFRKMTGETFTDAATLQDICKGLLCLSLRETSTSIDYHEVIAKAAIELNYALPLPIFFADTNWVKEDFCFVVNPGTGKLELWRGDYTGRNLAPMSSWDEWLNGSRKDRNWGVYTKPYEYNTTAINLGNVNSFLIDKR